MAGLDDGTIFDASLDAEPSEPIAGESPLLDLIVRDDGSLVSLSWASTQILVVDHATGEPHAFAAAPGFAEFGIASLAPGGDALLVATPDDVRRIEW